MVMAKVLFMVLLVFRLLFALGVPADPFLLGIALDQGFRGCVAQTDQEGYGYGQAAKA